MKNLEYWNKKFLETPQEDIVKELEEDISRKDFKSLAHAFVSVVGDMNKTWFRHEVTHNLWVIMRNIHKKSLMKKEDTSYEEELHKLNYEIYSSRENIEMFFEYEPAMRKLLQEEVDWYQQRAKKHELASYTKEEASKIHLPDLTLEEIIPSKEGWRDDND